MPEIRFRATRDEAAKVAAEAKARGLSVSEHIRDRLGLAPPQRQGAPLGSHNNPYGRAGKPK